MPVKWSLLWGVDLGVRSHAPPRDSIRVGACIAQNRLWEDQIRAQKKFAYISSGASLSRLRRHESSESASTDSQTRRSMSLRNPLDKAPDQVIAASIHASRGRRAVGISLTFRICVQRNFARAPLGDQMPSFALRRSFTACGFALPPDAFITWPTNHPIIVGFALACSTLSGFLATTSSTSFSIT